MHSCTVIAIVVLCLSTFLSGTLAAGEEESSIYRRSRRCSTAATGPFER